MTTGHLVICRSDDPGQPAGRGWVRAIWNDGFGLHLDTDRTYAVGELLQDLQDRCASGVSRLDAPVALGRVYSPGAPDMLTVTSRTFLDLAVGIDVLTATPTGVDKVICPLNANMLAVIDVAAGRIIGEQGGADTQSALTAAKNFIGVEDAASRSTAVRGFLWRPKWAASDFISSSPAPRRTPKAKAA